MAARSSNRTWSRTWLTDTRKNKKQFQTCLSEKRSFILRIWTSFALACAIVLCMDLADGYRFYHWISPEKQEQPSGVRSRKIMRGLRHLHRLKIRKLW